MRIVVYVGKDCPHCKEALAFIQNTLPPEVFQSLVWVRNVNEEPDALTDLLMMNILIVPVIVFQWTHGNKDIVVGFDKEKLELLLNKTKQVLEENPPEEVTVPKLSK